MVKANKFFLLHLLPLVVLIIVVFLLSCRQIDVDLLTEEAYKNFCYNQIMLNVESAKDILGVLSVSVGKNIFRLDTAFYELFIKNETHIREFLSQINWTKIIAENDYNLFKTNQIIVTEYIKYVITLESRYNGNIITKYNIFDAQVNVINALYGYMDLFKLEANLNSNEVFTEFQKKLMLTLDWANYIRTIDYQKEEYTIVKHLLDEEINNVVTSAQITLQYKISINDILINSIVVINLAVCIYIKVPTFILLILGKGFLVPLIRLRLAEMSIDTTNLSDELLWVVGKLIIKNEHSFEFLIKLIQLKLGWL